MRRRDLIGWMIGTACFWPFRAMAQQPSKFSVVGVLSPFTGNSNTLLPDLRMGLREYGLVEGQNLRIEYRSSNGQNEVLPELASELVRSKVDVIVTASALAVHAARQATSTIPIVFARVGDAVNQGIVTQLRTRKMTQQETQKGRGGISA